MVRGGRLGWSADDDRLDEKYAAELEQGIWPPILRDMPPNEPKPTEEEIRKMSEPFLAGQDRFALAAYRRSRRGQVITGAQMGAIKVPTLAIIGSADPIHQVVVEELNKVMPRLKVVVIEGATHTDAYQRLEFVQAIRDFIASHRGI